MDLERLSIGQMAELNHVSVQTLRLYDQMDLFKPIYVDENTNYRYYHINQSAQLDMILHMKDYGLTLEEIKVQISDHNMKNLSTFLKDRIKDLDKGILDLYRKKNIIKRNLENYQRYWSLPKEKVVFREYLEDRYIFTYKTEKNFFEEDAAGYEVMLRDLKNKLVEEEVPAAYFYNAGTLMRKKNIIENNFYANEVFVFLDESFKEHPEVERVPSGLYLSICWNDFQEEFIAANHLLAEISKKSYNIVGDYICEVIAEFPTYDTEGRNIFYKIQIPIR